MIMKFLEPSLSRLRYLVENIKKFFSAHYFILIKRFKNMFKSIVVSNRYIYNQN